MNCEHIYKNIGLEECPKCGQPTHETDWKKQNDLNKQWKIDHPEAKYAGWWSI